MIIKPLSALPQAPPHFNQKFKPFSPIIIMIIAKQSQTYVPSLYSGNQQFQYLNKPLSIQMGQSNSGQSLNTGEYLLQRELPNGAIVREQNGKLHFLKEYSFTNQQTYQQAFVNFSKKLPEKHQHILYLERTNTKLENTFCSTFYKISLLYEYLEHTLQKQIQQRNQQRKIFDQKEAWSVLCSCVLGVSEMIRVEGRSHAALTPKDIRLNQEGLVKILSLEMVGMDNDHDLNKEGTTRQLAMTILDCLLMEELNNDSEEFLQEVVQSLDSTIQMKNILRLMLKSTTKFIELEEYLFKMVQEETDSLNSYSNTPNLKDKPIKADNSYSKIPEESKEDDSLMPMTKDAEDCWEGEIAEPITSEEEIPDENDAVDDSTSKQSQQNTLRQSNTPQLSRNQSPASQKFNLTGSQENSLFTDPKLLNLIHSDLEQIKRRKSVAGSRKIGASDSKASFEKQTKVLQTNTFNMSQNVSLPSKEINKAAIITKNQNQHNEFKFVTISHNNPLSNNPANGNSLSNVSNTLNSSNVSSLNKQNHSQSTSNVRMVESRPKQELNHSRTTSNMRSESQQLNINSCNELSSNPERKVPQKKYDNIMEIEDMGFKKNKAPKSKQENKEQSRATSNIANSNANSTVVYNSNQSNNYNETKMPASSIIERQKNSQDLSQQSRVSKSTKGQLQYVTETYIRGRYEGTKSNNMRHGKGVFYYNEGGKYIGQWKENKMNGKGVLYYPNNEIAYDGEWKNDQLWGKGTLYNEEIVQLNGPFDFKNWEYADDYWIKYEGQFSEDSKNGQGKLYLSNGQILEGQFRNDMVWGEGVLLRKDGSRLRGLWKQNKLVKLYS